jgi:hypothetical protein
MTAAIVVFVLAALTSATNSALLFRAFSQSKVRLLLWTGLFFLVLTLSNLLLIVDAFTTTSFAAAQTVCSFLAISVLIFGLVWETK